MQSDEKTTKTATPGRIEKTLLRWLSRQATISLVEQITPRFRLIELSGEALRGIDWTPGQKIQIAIHGMRVARTYTPIVWDAERGVTRILVWLHGAGPGSEWAARVQPGDSCLIIGPRKSIEVAEGPEPIVVFGDETAFGLAAALRAREPDRSIHGLFETADADEARAVLEAVNIDAGPLSRRMNDDSHLEEIVSPLNALAKTGAVFVLAGRAQALQHASRALKAQGVSASRTRTKAYWAPGKTGLD